MRSAKIERIAERLAFGGDNIGAHLAGRAKRTEREDFGDDHHEQGPRIVADAPELRIILDFTKEIGVLYDDTGGITIDQPGEVLASRRGRASVNLEPNEARVGRTDLAVMRMDAASQDGLPAASDAVGHH